MAANDDSLDQFSNRGIHGGCYSHFTLITSRVITLLQINWVAQFTSVIPFLLTTIITSLIFPILCELYWLLKALMQCMNWLETANILTFGSCYIYILVNQMICIWFVNNTDIFYSIFIQFWRKLFLGVRLYVIYKYPNVNNLRTAVR